MHSVFSYLASFFFQGAIPNEVCPFILLLLIGVPLQLSGFHFSTFTSCTPVAEAVQVGVEFAGCICVSSNFSDLDYPLNFVGYCFLSGLQQRSSTHLGSIHLAPNHECVYEASPHPCKSILPWYSILSSHLVLFFS